MSTVWPCGDAARADHNAFARPTRSCLDDEELQYLGAPWPEYVHRINAGLADWPQIPAEWVRDVVRRFVPEDTLASTPHGETEADGEENRSP